MHGASAQMKWWVIRQGQIIGWVMAEEIDEAYELAGLKFPKNWRDEPAVEPKKQVQQA